MSLMVKKDKCIYTYNNYFRIKNWNRKLNEGIFKKRIILVNIIRNSIF